MGGADIGSFFLRLRLAQVGLTDEEINYGVLRYMMSLMLVLFLIELYRHKASSTKMKWLLFFNFFSIIATMAKTQMFWLLLPTFVILYKRKKLSKKILSLGIVLLIGIFALVQTLRGGGGGENETSLFETFISIYLLGGLPAFDQIVQANITSPVFGYCTLAFFRKILCIDLSNVESQMSSVFNEGIPGYAYVPLPTNVFTCLANPYLDFGITGIAVFALLSGSICGFFYKLLRKDVVWGTIGYSYLFSTICLQFFDDCLFKMMSQFLQFVLISWFACYFSKRIVIGKLHL
jgi:oligosaccharide repeat unit polymerase